MLTRIARPLVSTRLHFARAGYSTVVESDKQPQVDTAVLPTSNSSVTSPPTISTSKSSERDVVLDIPPAQDPLLHYLSSMLMRDGKRKRAEATVMKMLMRIHAFTRSPPMPIVREAISRASPSVKVITHKGSGKNTQIPVALNERQRTHFAVEWILEGSKTRIGRTIGERVAREIISIMKGESRVLEKKTNMHKLAMVNRGNIKLPSR